MDKLVISQCINFVSKNSVNSNCRVFSFGIGDYYDRELVDGIAMAGMRFSRFF